MDPLSSLMSRASTAARNVQTHNWPGWHQMLHLNWASPALAVIILGGTVLRILGGGWGLPLGLHPDEWVIVDGAIDMARRNSFEPHFFYRPDHVEMQLSYIAYVAYAHILHGSAPESLHALDPAPFILISRTITACFGVAMIMVAYLIGKRFTTAIGVLSAFLVAFFPLYVEHSHFATPDVPLSLALMVVILGCMRYLDSPSWGNLLAASLGVSVAIAIKYPGALGALMVAITVLVSSWRERAWNRLFVHGVGALAGMVGFLFAISPALLTKRDEVVSQLVGQAGTSHPGADGLGWSGNMSFYAETLATTAGVILLVCFALGLFWSVHLRLVQSLPLWMGAVYWVILSDVPVHWARWGLPMYLTPLLVAPIGAYYSFRYLVDAGSPRWLRVGAVGLGALTAANLILGSVAATASHLSEDTRTVAKKSFAVRGINGTNAVFDGYTPLLPGTPKKISDSFHVDDDGRLVLSSKNRETSKIRHAVVSSGMTTRYDANPKYSAEQRFYRDLNEQLPLVTIVEPAARAKATVLEVANVWNTLNFVGRLASGGLSGPAITLYEIPADRR